MINLFLVTSFDSRVCIAIHVRLVSKNFGIEDSQFLNWRTTGFGPASCNKRK